MTTENKITNAFATLSSTPLNDIVDYATTYGTLGGTTYGVSAWDKITIDPNTTITTTTRPPVTGTTITIWPTTVPIYPNPAPATIGPYPNFMNELNKFVRNQKMAEALKKIVNELEEQDQIKFVLMFPDLIDIIDEPSEKVKSALKMLEL
jgi:hypothetical protein